jgi:hypothetical protein
VSDEWFAKIGAEAKRITTASVRRDVPPVIDRRIKCGAWVRACLSVCTPRRAACSLVATSRTPPALAATTATAGSLPRHPFSPTGKAKRDGEEQHTFRGAGEEAPLYKKSRVHGSSAMVFPRAGQRATIDDFGGGCSPDGRGARRLAASPA